MPKTTVKSSAVSAVPRTTKQRLRVLRPQLQRLLFESERLTALLSEEVDTSDDTDPVYPLVTAIDESILHLKTLHRRLDNIL